MENKPHRRKENFLIFPCWQFIIKLYMWQLMLRYLYVFTHYSSTMFVSKWLNRKLVSISISLLTLLVHKIATTKRSKTDDKWSYYKLLCSQDFQGFWRHKLLDKVKDVEGGLKPLLIFMSELLMNIMLCGIDVMLCYVSRMFQK